MAKRRPMLGAVAKTLLWLDPPAHEQPGRIGAAVLRALSTMTTTTTLWLLALGLRVSAGKESR